jgi:hypothetical protein
MSGSHPLSVRTLAQELDRILTESERRGLTLRAFGGVGFYVHARDQRLFTKLGRDPVNDLDLVGLSEQRNEYKKLLKGLGYEVDRDLLVAGEGKRFSFQHAGESAFEVDLFIDRLDMCHSIDLRDRLELQSQTVPLADLLLEKLQIVDLNRKDIVDVVILLAEHELDGEGPTTVDLDYISRLLAGDWGFHYTVKVNLRKIQDFLGEAVAENERAGVAGRLERIEEEIDSAPKTRRWKLRAKIGTKKKWYQDVDEGTAAF